MSIISSIVCERNGTEILSLVRALRSAHERNPDKILARFEELGRNMMEDE